MKIINKSGKEEKFSNPVPRLLDALKSLLLLEKNFNENSASTSISQVYQCLKSFLLELEGEMEEDENQAELPIQPGDFEKKLRTVQSIFRRSRSDYGIGRRVPVISLSGFWLADYGFGINERFSVYAGEDRLILKKEKNIVKAARKPKHKPSKVHPAALGVFHA